MRVPAGIVRTKGCVSRRDLFEIVCGAAVFSLAGADAAQADSGSYPPPLSRLFEARLPSLTASLEKAYSFLDVMMDAYAQGSTLRLIQSYSDQQGLESTAFTYDNAVSIHALLVRGTSDDITRAEVLGNTLLYAQQNDSFHDGRVRQAYFVHAADARGAYVQPAGAPFSFHGSSTGDMAWAGMALAQLYRRTKDGNYLSGAIDLGNWILNHTCDTRGAGGYNGGVDGDNVPLSYKATEHNIDTYAFFRMLATLTGNRAWTTRAQHALSLLSAMWNSAAGFFWTGTGSDGATINTSNIPADVQTWSYLALLDGAYASALDWAKTNLATIDSPQSVNSKLPAGLRLQGLTFASESLHLQTPSASYDQPPDRDAVWLEGTAHAAAAFLLRGLSSQPDSISFHDDSATALLLLDSIRLAQSKLGADQTIAGGPIAAGGGIVSSSSVCNTGFGSSYYPNLHIGATAWYLIAGQAADPFRLGYHPTESSF